MTTEFRKSEFNKDYDHQASVVETFSELGFNDVKIETSLTNGLSHYVKVLDFQVSDESKLYSEMFVFEGETFITVRISDHTSNLDTICGGVSGNKMNLNAFKNLIKNGAISPKK